MAFCASCDTNPSEGVCCSPWAVATPCARSWMAASDGGARRQARMPPSSRTSPPSARACTPLRVKPVSGELHHAPRTAQGGRVRGDSHLVARQRHAALHLGLVDLADGQAQPQLQIGVARAAGLGQGVAGAMCARGEEAHQAQHFRQRPPRLGVHPHHGAVQVGICASTLVRRVCGRPDLKVPRRPLYLHGRALKDQLTRELRERWPAQRFVRLQAGRHVGIGHVLHLRGDAEVAPLRGR